jgi:hypothetical protein
MAKTHAQIEAERKQKIEERQKYLLENREVYQRDFDEAFQQYLIREYPELDPENCDNRFNPHLKEEFTRGWPQEAKDLSLKYSLVPVWDPDGEEPPYPVTWNVVREIRCQDDRIWLNQIKKDSIINLPPTKVFGRFLIVEIDLSRPRSQIKANLMGLVDARRKQVKISGSHHELVVPPEPKNKESSYTYKKVEVWKMVEEEREGFEEEHNKILSRLAKKHCGLSEEDADFDDRVKAEYKALKNAYVRDKKIYYGKL